MATMEVTAVNEAQVSNDAAELIQAPFSVTVTIRGTKDILFHAWSNEDVQAKAEAEKGSATKKMDNLESYIYRNDEGQICLPARYLVRSVVEAGRNFSDPRSPRKSAKDLISAALMAEELLSPIIVNGKPATAWDYEDRQRVCIQRAAVTRTRPAFKKGWEAEFNLVSLVPAYLTEDFLRKLIDSAGLLVGVGDFRPSYGRFKVTHWERKAFVDSDVAVA